MNSQMLCNLRAQGVLHKAPKRAEGTIKKYKNPLVAPNMFLDGREILKIQKLKTINQFHMCFIILLKPT